MAHFRHSQTLRHVYDCSRPASVSFVLQRVSIYVAAIPSCRGQAKNTLSSDGHECKCELDKIMRTATPDEFETTPDTQTAFDNQDGIGWQALLEGAPAKGWSDAQQRYYDALGKRNTGERWLTAIIQKLWDVAWDLWTTGTTCCTRKTTGFSSSNCSTTSGNKSR